MVQSKAKTVSEYLAALPEDRRRAIETVRRVVKKHLPKGYEEAINCGMIAYQVPLETLPDTYNGQPLCYAALAAQKNFNTLYLMVPYGDKKKRAELEKAFEQGGKKLDMGKSCVHFKDADDLPLSAIGKFIAAVPAAKYIEAYHESRKKK